MHQLLVHLTAALLFIHGVVGCCWHHAHASQADYGSLGTFSHADHSDDDRSCPAGNHQHGPNECTKGKCVFVRSANVHPMCLAVASIPLALPTRPIIEIIDRPVLLSGWSWGCRAFDVSIRLHLAYQVLLI